MIPSLERKWPFAFPTGKIEARDLVIGGLASLAIGLTVYHLHRRKPKEIPDFKKNLFIDCFYDPTRESFILPRTKKISESSHGAVHLSWEIQRKTGTATSEKAPVIFLSKEEMSVQEAENLQRLRKLISKNPQRSFRGLEIPELIYDKMGRPIKRSNRYLCDLHAYVTLCYEQRIPIPRANKKQIVDDLICGLQTLHGLNVAHRDIKMENVLINLKSPKVEAVWIDFEACGFLDDPPSRFVYTYLSREVLQYHRNGFEDWQLRIPKETQRSSDIFGFGLIAYCLYRPNQSKYFGELEDVFAPKRWPKDYSFFKGPIEEGSLEQLIHRMCGPQNNRPTIEEIAEKKALF